VVNTPKLVLYSMFYGFLMVVVTALAGAVIIPSVIGVDIRYASQNQHQQIINWTFVAFVGGMMVVWSDAFRAHCAKQSAPGFCMGAILLFFIPGVVWYFYEDLHIVVKLGLLIFTATVVFYESLLQKILRWQKSRT
jgi:peptidoglycan/LPS O-acetylase OafA/YrhL